jgi:hypothetical protein
VIFDLFEEPGGREVRNHLFARGKPVETAVAAGTASVSRAS